MAQAADWLARQAGYLEAGERERLARARVAVLGLGGVGGVAAELLARAGVGALNLCDPESFEPSNLNRQVGALSETIGRNKAQVMAERLGQINPDLQAQVLPAVADHGAGARGMLAGCAAGVLAIDRLRPALQALRAGRALGVPLVEVLALPVLQARVYDPAGPDPEEGLPSQGRDLGPDAGLDDDELARAYAARELPRLGDGQGGPLAFAPGMALAMLTQGAPPSLGPLVWLAGAMSALETLKLILERGSLARHPGRLCLDPCAWRLHLAE